MRPSGHQVTPRLRALFGAGVSCDSSPSRAFPRRGVMWLLTFARFPRRGVKWLFFLRRLRKFGTSPRILRSFYTCTVESILTGCITAWFGNSTAGNRRALQRVVRTARHIVGGELPSLQDIYTRRCTRKARRIIKDSSHPSHRLLSLLPSGRRFRSIRSRTSRLRDSFFPQAIRLMNSQKWPTLQHTPTHTTCHALHFNTVQLDYTHTLH